MAKTPRQQIALIDKMIDANCAELEHRVGCHISATAASWQKAWDAHPDLKEKNHILFCSRGTWQAMRDEADDALARRERAKKERADRQRKPTPCPTCGLASFAAIAP